MMQRSQSVRATKSHSVVKKSPRRPPKRSSLVDRFDDHSGPSSLSSPPVLKVHAYVTGPEKTSLIYTKYTYVFILWYLAICVCYTKSVSFIGNSAYVYDVVLSNIPVV